MANTSDSRKSAKLAPFAHKELDDLVSDLYTQLHIKTSSQDVLGALVIAARKAPLELVAALLPGFVAREGKEKGPDAGDPAP